jgi:hypothetical protein
MNMAAVQTSVLEAVLTPQVITHLTAASRRMAVV